MIFLTRNTCEKKSQKSTNSFISFSWWQYGICLLLCSCHLAKRALAEDFEQFKLRWIGLLTALFYMMGDRNLLICPVILHKQVQYETGTHGCCYSILHAHNNNNNNMLQDLKPIITYTVWERLSLLHGLVHDLMSIDLQPDQQISEESTTVNTSTKLVHPCFQLSRTMAAAPARPHVWWNIQQMKSMSHMQKQCFSFLQLKPHVVSNIMESIF